MCTGQCMNTGPYISNNSYQMLRVYYMPSLLTLYHVIYIYVAICNIILPQQPSQVDTIIILMLKKRKEVESHLCQATNQ